MGCSCGKLTIKYLGLSLGANYNRWKSWEPIIEHTQKRLSMWKCRLVSKAGRVELIKTVINSLPTYYLSIFRMPKKSSIGDYKDPKEILLVRM